MNKFYAFYRWGVNTKYLMGMYAMASLAVFSIMVLCFGGRSVPVFLIIEMILVSFLTAVVQKAILPSDSDYEGSSLKKRAALWFIVSIVITCVAAYGLGWFSGFNAAAPVIYILFMIFVYGAMWFGLYLEQQVDTKKLNERLAEYQRDMKR